VTTHRSIAALVALVGACSGTPSEPAPRTPSVEAAPAGDDARDAGLDDAAPPDAAPVLPVLAVPPGALDGFHAALDRAADGRVLVMVFGDSHTAGDQLTGTLRRLLGAAHGFGGRGFVLPGRPAIRHYYLRDVAYGSEGKWQAELGGKRDNREPFGLAGVRSHTTDKRAVAWVATCASCPVDQVARFDIFHLMTATSGAFSYRVDDGPWTKVSTRLPRGAAGPTPTVTPVAVPDGRHKLTLKHAGGGPIELFGVALERDRGVVVDALGVVGRRLTHLASWDWSVIGPQVSARAPALVVLQYGTNEADDRTLDLGALARAYDKVIAEVRAAAPGASILLLGPPDMGEREAGRACDKLPPPADPDAGVPFECQWRTPAMLPLVIDVQRQAAARNQVAFFDTFAAMGGGNQMEAMFTADPPLAFSDHVHLTALGYQRWAELLGAALADERARWRAIDPTARPAP
jgi:lysophospholipase L1-like esterase